MSNAPSHIGVPEWTLTDRLRKARETAGYNQQELADASHGELSLRTISNYENEKYGGQRKRLTVRSWAFTCGVPFSWLWEGTEPDDDDGQEVALSTNWYAHIAADELFLLPAA